MWHTARWVLGFGTVALVGATLVWGEGAQPAPYRPDRPIAIVGGLLIDATGGPPKQDQTVVITGERIVDVGPMEQVKVPAGAEVIDATGMTIMPGLINSNQHIQLNPMYPAPTANLPLADVKARWEHNWAQQPRRAWVYLMQGITSLRQTSGPAKQILPVKQAIDRGELPGPRVFLGGALFMSDEHFDGYVKERGTPSDAVSWMRNEFAYNVIADVQRDTDAYVGPEFNYWKLYMANDRWDGRNDFSDEELRFMIDKAHKSGKIVDVHAGGHNDGLRRMLAFDVDTLEHPFYGHELIDMEIIQGFVKKGVIVDTLLTVMIVGAQRAADPHRFDETLYTMSMDPREHRILMQYRDTMLQNLRTPNERGLPIYDVARPPDFPEVEPGTGNAPENMTTTGRGPSVAQQQQQLHTSKENMRRFIKAGAKFAMGTDTGSFLNFQQEDPNANEMMYMVEMGMTPMQAIEASTRNGAEALGLLKDLGTIEKGKLADVIVVAGNPLQNMAAMKRVSIVVKGGVRYK
ncbi:MAG: amidohydrolase family protein [Vicinamibacterales bacterium]